jgi:glycosyltransferase involved in cell wall biosynthesis
MISQYFPPMGKGSVIRPVKFAKYFPRFNWEPIIITDTPKNYFAKDDYLLNELNDEHVRIIRTHLRGRKNLLNDNKLKRLANEGTRRFFQSFSQVLHLPDSKKKWEKKAFKLASEIIETENISIIYTNAPPFRDFVIASELKKKYRIPVVADYAESWLFSPSRYYITPYHRFRNMKLEIELLRSADVILTVNRRIKEKIIETYPYIKHTDIDILHHGYDKEDFDKFNTQLPRTNKMRFTHTGQFFNNNSAEYFLEALALVFRRRPELKKKIEACFIGVLTKEQIHLINKLNLFDTIYSPGFINHKECIKYMLASDVLWFTVGKGDGDELVTPVKLSEYIGAKKPLLACIPDGAAKLMLRQHNAVKICEPDKPEEIAEMILEYYELYSKNEMPVPGEEFVKKFDIETLTYQLVRSLEFLIDISPQSVIKGTHSEIINAKRET